MSNSQQKYTLPCNTQLEISINDVVDFLRKTWKKLAISAVVGAALGVGSWYLLNNYSAEYVLANDNGAKDSYEIDIVSWKKLQMGLPNLAHQMVEENKVPINQNAIFRQMAREQWWQKNIVPNYAISKADIKNLAGIGKELDGASTRILSFTLSANGSSRQQAIESVREFGKFLRSGGSYLELRTLLNYYEIQTVFNMAYFQGEISKIQAEMGFQQERIRQLDDLHKRFPGSNSPAQQVVDLQDASAKYLPLQTQIIAANNDLNESKENLVRMQKRLEELGLAKAFLEKAMPLKNQTFDGLLLGQKLLDVEVSLRGALPKDDSHGFKFLDRLRLELLKVQLRFTDGLEASGAPSIKKSSMMLTFAAAIGAVVACFFMLMILLRQKVMVAIRAQYIKVAQ